MDPRLLDYYNRELSYMRELGAEFAQQHPKVAGRLGMTGIEVADPYVERLLEGFAFLAGRIHLKMDAEFPRFSQRLLELVYPHYLKPTPAIGIARLTPSLSEGGVTAAYEIPRHTVLRSPIAPGQVTSCQFRTAHHVTLLPLDLTQASIEGPSTRITAQDIPADKTVRSSLRMSFSTHNKMEVRKLGAKRLSLYISGPAERASHLLELVGGRVLGGYLSWQEHGSTRQHWISPSSIRCDGISEEESLLPYDNRSFSGYRLLHEYFACPDRFRFFSVNNLDHVLTAIADSAFTITLLFDQAATALEKVVDKKDFELHCTPIINLFPWRGDRVDISLGSFEHHILADKTRPLDYEVHSISQLYGYTASNVEQQVFRPIFETLSDHGNLPTEAFFSWRREPRKLSETARRGGTRSGYIGSEVFVQLVDRNDAPYSKTIERIAPDMLCTNRDLSLLMGTDGERDLQLTISAPVSGVTILGGLTPPIVAMAERDITWKLLTHLHLNYHTLTDLNAEDGAKVMRDLLSLYSPLGGRGVRGQAEAVRSLSTKPMVYRMPMAGPIVFGRGVQFETKVDESSFAGSSPWLFGAILEQFLTRHVSINAAVQMRMSTLQRGTFATWPVRAGSRPIA